MCVCASLLGPTNKKLRVHLPLLAPSGGLSRLRVGFETREAVAGHALVFDDSFEHEAWNDNDNEDDNVNDYDDHSGTDNSTDNDNETSPSEGVSGRGEAEPRPQGRAEAEGEGRDSSPDEERRRREVEARSGRSRAAPRVTLIADVWHPDLSNR